MNKFSCHIYPLYMLIMQVSHDSGHICPTPVEKCNSSHMRDSGCMSNSGQKKRPRSYAHLWSKDATPVVYPDSSRTFQLRLTCDSGHLSRIRSRITTSVDERTACLTNLSAKDYAWLSYMTVASYNSNT
jgi:hypothetical protein